MIWQAMLKCICYLHYLIKNNEITKYQRNWFWQDQKKLLYKHINTLSLTMSSISNPTKNILSTLTMDNITTCIISLNEAAVFIVLATEASDRAVEWITIDVFENLVEDCINDDEVRVEIGFEGTVKLILTVNNWNMIIMI